MSDAVIYHTLIKEMPAGERPRERLALYGENALSNAELLAIALATGTRHENVVGLAQRSWLTGFWRPGRAGPSQH